MKIQSATTDPSCPEPCLSLLLRRQRRGQGLTLAALAKRVGVTPGYLSMIENRRVGNPPSIKVLAKLEAALQVRDGALCRAAQWQRTPEPIRQRLQRAEQACPAPPRPPTRVPLVDKVVAGAPAGLTGLGGPVNTGGATVLVPGYTGPLEADDPDAFAATVCGDAMLPAYRAGDVVVFSPLADVLDGSDCLVRLKPVQQSTFTRVIFGPGPGGIRLEPINPDYPSRVIHRDQVAGLFRAVWRMSRL